jgi:hypothetical protein
VPEFSVLIGNVKNSGCSIVTWFVTIWSWASDVRPGVRIMSRTMISQPIAATTVLLVVPDAGGGEGVRILATAGGRYEGSWICGVGTEAIVSGFRQQKSQISIVKLV